MLDGAHSGAPGPPRSGHGRHQRFLVVTEQQPGAGRPGSPTSSGSGRRASRRTPHDACWTSSSRASARRRTASWWPATAAPRPPACSVGPPTPTPTSSCACAIQDLSLAAPIPAWRALGHTVEASSPGRPAGCRTAWSRSAGCTSAGPTSGRRPGARAGGFVPTTAAGGGRAARALARALRGAAAPPPSHLRSPNATRVVGARDQADQLLTPFGSLGPGPLHRQRGGNRTPCGRQRPRAAQQARGGQGGTGLTRSGLSAYADSVTDDVLSRSRAGSSGRRCRGGTVARLDFTIIDAGTSSGDLRGPTPGVRGGRRAARGARPTSRARQRGGARPGRAGRGRGRRRPRCRRRWRPACWAAGRRRRQVGARADGGVAREREVSMTRSSGDSAVRRPARQTPRRRWRRSAAEAMPCWPVWSSARPLRGSGGARTAWRPRSRRSARWASSRGRGLLVAGQRSRGARAGPGPPGLEPLLDLRLRAGEGVGAALACGLLADAVRVRRGTAPDQADPRTGPSDAAAGRCPSPSRESPGPPARSSRWRAAPRPAVRRPRPRRRCPGWRPTQTSQSPSRVPSR